MTGAAKRKGDAFLCAIIEARPNGAGNTERPLTHPLDYGEEGLAMNATHYSNNGHLHSCACGCGQQCYGEYARTHRPGEPLAERLWRRIIKTGSGCWEWQGCRTATNYGQIALDKSGRLVGTHRAAWIVTHGNIPAGLFVCHRCDNPPCCNPDHLFLGTHQENIDDAMQKGRIAASRARGVKAANGRLTDQEVSEILRRYRSGVHPARRTGASSSELGAEFGVTRQYVNQLARGLWRA